MDGGTPGAAAPGERHKAAEISASQVKSMCSGVGNGCASYEGTKHNRELMGTVFPCPGSPGPPHCAYTQWGTAQYVST